MIIKFIKGCGVIGNVSVLETEEYRFKSYHPEK